MTGLYVRATSLVKPIGSVMAVTRTTPLTTTRPAPREEAKTQPNGARFEAPIHTVPYPIRDCRTACVETRDLVADEDDFLF